MIPNCLKTSRLPSAGNSYVSWASEAIFSLGWQSPRDGFSKKILVVVQRYNTLAYDEND